MGVEFPFESFKGMTFKNVYPNPDNDRLYIDTIDGDEYVLYHQEECCESVYIESIVGDLRDIINSPILLAEEVTGHYDRGDPIISEDFAPLSEEEESWTWTFYKLSTIKGSVTIRWYGSSNGYYSEGVTCERV
jgi:hypothetical protein